MNHLVDADTNKFIYESYHHVKYKENYNLNAFISFINGSEHIELKEYNQITNFFRGSIDIIAQEILDDLIENGLSKENRLELFLNDLEETIKMYKEVLNDFSLNNIEYFYKSARKNIMSDNNNLSLAIADIRNLLQNHTMFEKELITYILKEMSSLISRSHQFILNNIFTDDNKLNTIKEYFELLCRILMNKNITIKEIIDLFKKLCSNPFYMKLKDERLFYNQYPLDLEKQDGLSTKDYRFELMKIINNLTIEDRFCKFAELLYEEKDCYYIFEILNTELYDSSEANHGNIIYYDSTVYKSKGDRYDRNIENKDSFNSKNNYEVKALVPFKSKRYFPNISLLQVKNILENNIIFFKLFTNKNDSGKDSSFEPSSLKINVSNSYFVLDKDFYMIASVHTKYENDFTFRKNEILHTIYVNEEYENKFNTYLSHINHKQIENKLTNDDYLILQLLKKYKQSAEATSYSDALLYTWNGFEFLSKAFANKKDKLSIIQELVALIYRLIYINKPYKWDLNKKSFADEINRKAKRLVIYAYTYRNKLVHSHLVENSFMISISKGINIIFKHVLILIIDIIIVNSNLTIEDIINQIKSDLNKKIKELSNGK